MIESVFVEIAYEGSFIKNATLLRGQTMTVGRESGDMIFRHDLEMSGTHFRIEVDETECRVIDLESTNFTWLNENKIQRATVSDGDRLRAGKTVFKIHIQQSTPVFIPNVVDPPPIDVKNVTTPVPLPSPPPPTEETEDSWIALLKNVETDEQDTPADPKNSKDSKDPIAARRPISTVSERKLNSAVPLEIELTVIQGQAPEQKHSIHVGCATQIIIGREESVDVRVTDEKVSTQHCRIEMANHSLVLRDLNSTNGTMLNGQEVTEARISDGDQLKLGDTVLSIHITYDESNVDHP